MSSGADSARVFFALDPDPALRHRLGCVQRELRLPARPVPVANLHITLVFLGQVAWASIEALKKIADDVSLPRCELVLDRVGWFPRAGVAWLGSTQPPGELAAFQSRLSERLREQGFRTDPRPWTPHLTLYRKLRNPGCSMDIEPLNWRIERFCLLRTKPVKNGVEYEQLGRWPVHPAVP